MRHKTITLCPTTYELSKKMPNFSQWVRDQVLKHGRTNNMHKESRIMFHRECGNDVPADWKQFTDGTFAWFGYCDSCNTDVVWRPRQWVKTVHFTLTTIGLPGNQHLIGCCHLISTKVLKVHGGNVLAAMKYSSRLHFAHATHVIHSQDIAGSVHHEWRYCNGIAASNRNTMRQDWIFVVSPRGGTTMIEWERNRSCQCDGCYATVFKHEPMYYYNGNKICELCAVVLGL